MIDFFRGHNINDLIILILGLMVAIEGIWKLADFFVNKYHSKFKEDYSEIEKEKEIKKRQETLEQHYINCKDQHEETIKMYNTLENKMDNLIDTVNTKFEDFDEKIGMLTDSDALDIKHGIVQSYHYYVEGQGWIDDFTLDILERRFAIYKAEGGNSYAEGLMSEIRQLPKRPPN